MRDDVEYKLNVDYVLREEDRALFNVERMRIYELNESGYDLLSFFMEGRRLGYRAWLERAGEINSAGAEELERFFSDAVANGILLGE